MPDWTDTFLAASQQLLPQASPSQLCALAKGLSRLRIRPTTAWWRGFEAACTQYFSLGRFSTQGLADMAAAMALAGWTPAEAWARAWMCEVEKRSALFDGHALVKATWAAAKLRLKPAVTLKRALAGAAASPHLLRQLAPEDLAQLPWALVQLYVLPGQELADGLVSQICRRLGAMSGLQLVRATWSLSRLRTAPKKELLLLFVDVVEERLRGGGNLFATAGAVRQVAAVQDEGQQELCLEREAMLRGEVERVRCLAMGHQTGQQIGLQGGEGGVASAAVVVDEEVFLRMQAVHAWGARGTGTGAVSVLGV